ncbi:PA14 domain-containing protein, partial [Chitinophaga sp.]|uniref:PA14 domain-containing protein n=1 Tax=Chitinophaga sp. TaxID=1869181 RepID=UPI002F94A75E
MILAFAAKGKKTIACVMLALIYLEAVIPAYALGSGRTVYRAGKSAPVLPAPVGGPAPAVVPTVAVSKAHAPSPVAAAKGTGGPTQPEMEAFHSVNSDNMVDLFTGNFSYNIPLMDVGGYPIALGYSSGITMDDEASWTGLGWNINPGTITRNVRGLPDDFNGLDSVKKTLTIKENKTTGGSLGIGAEMFGFDLKGILGSIADSASINASASIGAFKNTYRGWGMEASIDVGISASNKNAGSLTAGLGLGMNTQDQGLSISPSLDLALHQRAALDHTVYGGQISSTLTYNTRSGMKALQYSAGVKKYKNVIETKGEGKDATSRIVTRSADVGKLSSTISYAYPSSIPAMSIPYTTEMYTGKFAIGGEVNGFHPQAFATGYQSKQYIAAEDRVLTLPAFGYLYSYNGANQDNALLDYNREREMPVKEGIKNIAIPSYTSDVFSISGEGTGGMFRAFRSDIGSVHDHYMTTRDKSFSLGGEVGLGNAWHAGVDLTLTHSTTVNGPWKDFNPLAKDIAFTQSQKQYEAVYFRNPGEMTIMPKAYYEMLGGDDVVFPELTGNNTPNISTTDNVWRYKGGKLIGKVPFNNVNTANQERSKRTQVISYLTAEEASMVGLTKLIENYGENQYVFNNCITSYSGVPEERHGFLRESYQNEFLDQKDRRIDLEDALINFTHAEGGEPDALTTGTGLSNKDHMSFRWTGKLKAPASGSYYFWFSVDDGVRIYINGKMITKNSDWDYNRDIPKPLENGYGVNLEKGISYDLKVEYYNTTVDAKMVMKVYEDGNLLGAKEFYRPEKVFSYTILPGKLTKEERVDNIR